MSGFAQGRPWCDYEIPALYRSITPSGRCWAFHVGILDKWDAAVRRRDRREMMALLEQVEVADPHLTVDIVLANPQAYGF